VLSLLHFQPELGLAFVLVRATKRLRLPLDLATAAFIGNTFPVLKSISLESMTPHTKHKALYWLKGSVDQYGVSYLLSSKLNGVVGVVGVYSLLRSGIDLSYYVGGAGEHMSSFAAAALVNGLVSPFVGAGMLAYLPQHVLYALRFTKQQARDL
jgi:hypothetical protein